MAKTKLASGETSKRKAAPASGKRRAVEAWEREEAIQCLALTGSISETARRMGRDVAVIHRIKTDSLEQIAQVRQRLAHDLHVEFVATVRETQQCIRNGLTKLEMPDSPADQAKHFDTLLKILSTEVDKQAVLLEKPIDPVRIDGDGGWPLPPTAVSEEEEVEQDKDYLRDLLDQIKEEDGGLP